MKAFSCFLAVLFLLQSCSTVIYKKHLNQNDFSKVKQGEQYLFYGYDLPKKRVRVSEIKQDTIVGRMDHLNVNLAKNDIRVIKKSNPKAVVAIVLGGVGGALLLGYLMSEAISID